MTYFVFSGENGVVDQKTLDFESEMIKTLLNKTGYPSGLQR